MRQQIKTPFSTLDSLICSKLAPHVIEKLGYGCRRFPYAHMQLMCWPMGSPSTDVGVGRANRNLTTLWLTWSFFTHLNFNHLSSTSTAAQNTPRISTQPIDKCTLSIIKPRTRFQCSYPPISYRPFKQDLKHTYKREGVERKEMKKAQRGGYGSARTFLAVDKVEEGGACDDRNQRECNAHLRGFVILQLLQHALHRPRPIAPPDLTAPAPG
jgi:hypothetical protein